MRDALRLVCVSGRSATYPLNQKAIIIGFLGGFVQHDDLKHPETWFAAFLREHYGPRVYARAFSNHEGILALQDVMRLLDSNCDGVVTDIEKRQAKIIIYGHSWGASEAAEFARKLQRFDIPVLLTVQIDIIGKPQQKPTRIPPNVREAVNFFQTEGILHGRPKIFAADPVRTEIIGDFRMTYEEHRVDCGNYPWYARAFDRPHHEIENDARVWNAITMLIDSALLSPGPGGSVSATKLATSSK